MAGEGSLLQPTSRTVPYCLCVASGSTSEEIHPPLGQPLVIVLTIWINRTVYHPPVSLNVFLSYLQRSSKQQDALPPLLPPRPPLGPLGASAWPLNVEDGDTEEVWATKANSQDSVCTSRPELDPQCPL